MPQFQHRSRSASCWLPFICLRPFPHWCPYRPDPVRPRQQPCPDPPIRRHDSVHGAPVGAHTLAEGQAGGADTSGGATIGLSDEFMMNRQLTRATSRPARSPAAARTRPSCAPVMPTDQRPVISRSACDGAPGCRPYASASSSVRNSTGIDRKVGRDHHRSHPQRSNRYKIRPPKAPPTSERPVALTLRSSAP